MIAPAVAEPLSKVVERVIREKGPQRPEDLDREVAAAYPGVIPPYGITYATADLVSSGKITWTDTGGWGIRTR